jgi:exoribonuclease-2
MTRAEVVISDVDLLQLSAGVRVLEIEAKVDSPEKAVDQVAGPESSANPEADASSD